MTTLANWIFTRCHRRSRLAKVQLLLQYYYSTHCSKALLQQLTEVLKTPSGLLAGCAVLLVGKQMPKRKLLKWFILLRRFQQNMASQRS
ncbi:hypothetical protein ACFOEE_16880 [Pseudoalteromonas fenneropenaei]|uniref:Uncharacterized protein n=1 Tax=Pseudoalteromonas fenneropenaei TaxID=1737459 RepID=A0ABV7CNL2_9GAMM